MILYTDFLTRIKNGYRAGKKQISAPVSKFTVSLAQILKRNGFIQNYEVTGDPIKTMTITLAYNQDNSPIVNDVKIYSTPGRRLYEKKSSIPWGISPKSLIIISTSSGLLSQREAVVKGIGGEIIAQIS